MGSDACQSSDGAPSQLKIKKKTQHAVDQLRLVPSARGSLAARGRPNPETLLALQHCKGVTAVVTLLRQDEGPGAAALLGQACERLGLKRCHAPLAGPKEMGMIGSGKVMLTHEDIESFRKVRQAKEWLESGGDNIVVHCAAGLHRTGIFLYVLLRELGELPTDALNRIQLMRPETADEFTRLNFQSKADAIFGLVASKSQVASSVAPSGVAVVAERAIMEEHEPEEDDDDEDEDEDKT